MTHTTTRQDGRRRIILDSDRQLLCDHGCHAVAIDEIGAASGLTGPAVYCYFASKPALLAEAVSHAAAELWSRPPPDIDAGLDACVDSHARAISASDQPPQCDDHDPLAVRPGPDHVEEVRVAGIIQSRGHWSEVGELPGSTSLVAMPAASSIDDRAVDA